MAKPWWQSKTIWVGVAAVLASTVGAWVGPEQWDAAIQQWGTPVSGALMVLLRIVTSSSVSK